MSPLFRLHRSCHRLLLAAALCLGGGHFGIVLLAAAAEPSVAPEYPRQGPDLFDPQANGEILIDLALKQARVSERRVFVFVGANWCPWTRRLHRLMQDSPMFQQTLQRKFVIVYLDANTRHDRRRNAAVLARLGDPQRRLGIPVFVLLDTEGRVELTQETQSFAAPDDATVAARLDRFAADLADDS